jgi:hypothetical protein
MIFTTEIVSHVDADNTAAEQEGIISDEFSGSALITVLVYGRTAILPASQYDPNYPNHQLLNDSGGNPQTFVFSSTPLTSSTTVGFDWEADITATNKIQLAFTNVNAEGTDGPSGSKDLRFAFGLDPKPQNSIAADGASVSIGFKAKVVACPRLLIHSL